LIISHTPHYIHSGQIVGWGPTIREVDHLTNLFKKITHLAVLYPDPAPSSCQPYTSASVEFIPVQPSGGQSLFKKIGILRTYPSYIRAIQNAVDQLAPDDVIHVRCPANLSMLALFYLTFRIKPPRRWVKFAGNWSPPQPDFWSYRLQRWLLVHKWPRSLVTVNGKWPMQQQHILSFLNPCLTSNEIESMDHVVKDKQMELPLELLFVGRLEDEKGAGRCLEIIRQLVVERVNIRLTLVGDGPDRSSYEVWVQSNELSDYVKFAGWVPRNKMGEYYSKAHLMIHPSDSSEGWPKVLSEAMAYGVVPLAGAVSSIPQVLNEFHVGTALPPKDVDTFIAAIREYMSNPDRWKRESQAGKDAAIHFTYEAYLNQLKAMFKTEWGLEL